MRPPLESVWTYVHWGMPGREGSPQPADPVVEAYKKDVDRSLLRRNLQLTPEERVRKLQDFVALLVTLRDAGRQVGS